MGVKKLFSLCRGLRLHGPHEMVLFKSATQGILRSLQVNVHIIESLVRDKLVTESIKRLKGDLLGATIEGWDNVMRQ